MKLLDQQMKAAKSDTERIHLLGDALWDVHTKDLELGDSIGKIELELGRESKFPKYEADAYNDAGVVKYRKGDYNTCKEYYLRSLEIRQKIGDEVGVASSLGKLGALYQKLGDLDKALDCQLKCLSIQEKLNNSVNIAMTLNNIAVIHSNQKQYRKAIGFASKALSINQAKKSNQGILANYNTIGSAYINLELYDSALLYLNSMVELADKVGDKYVKGIALNNIGNTYQHKGDSVTALSYYLKALAVAEEMHNKAATGMYSQNVGDVYMHNHDYAKAETYLLKSYEIATELNQKPVLYLTGFSLYNLYKHKGDFAKAAAYVEQAMSIKDSVFNEESSKQIAEMQTKYDTEKKEKELQIQKLEVNRRNILLIVLCIVFILAGIIAWLAYNRYKIQQKAILNATLLKQQEIRSKAVLEAEEHERQRIGKDLHDGVGQILSAAKLNLSALQSQINVPDQNTKDMMQNALDLVDESVKEVRAISHNMMPNMLIKSGLASAVRDFVNKMSGTNKLKIDLDIVGINERLDPTTESVLYRVLQELVSNVIRHSGANHVTIQLLKHEHELTMMVEDNGKGFDVAKTIEGEHGIGLKNIQSRIEYLRGQIHYDSMIGKGTTVSIEIPV
jgi:signal transduction histidine kinase